MRRQETGQYLVKSAEPLPPRPTVAPPSPPPSSGVEPWTVMVRRRGDTAWLEPVVQAGEWEYTCTVCGTSGVWGPSWSWFGSFKDAERNPGALPVFCAELCRQQWAADNGQS
jgi:hypothetical protein